MLPWREKASAVAAALAVKPAVWPDRDTAIIGVGCSGGADSVCLLLLAWLRYGERLRVLHLNHGLRGAESEGDASYVEQLARELGMTFIGEKLAAPPGNISEAWLREQRLDFFRRSGCGVILLGHHADDVAETLLMRLSRGSGTEGLAAPLPVQTFSDGLTLMRPFLDLPKSVLTDALRAANILWREDASNVQPDYFRNRIRSEVLPALLQVAPGNARAGLARTHRLLAEDAVALNSWLDSFGLVIANGKPLDLTRLQPHQPALRRRAVQRWLACQGLHEHLSAAAVDELLVAMAEGRQGRMSAGRDQTLIFAPDRLCLEKNTPHAEVFLCWPVSHIRDKMTLYLPHGGSLCLEHIELDAPLRQQIMRGEFAPGSCAWLAAERASTPLLVRAWEPGDRVHLLGAPGSRKLQDAFTDAKIPVLERKRLPVVSSPTSDILWVPGLPPAESHKIGPQTQWAFRLTYASH